MTWIHLDRTSDIPLYRQIYDSFRSKILQGEMKSGEKLPSSRELAVSLLVSRNIIVEAYDQLLSEGYIEGRHGSGTFVAEGTYLEHLTQQAFIPIESARETNEKNNDLIHFRAGIPALDLFPRKTWGKLADYICTNAPDEAFGYGKPEGRYELRSVLAQYLRRTRGVICTPEQLLITTGATQALSMIAKLLYSPDAEIIVEDPVTHEIHTIFSMPGATLYPIPVDEHGLRTELLPSHKKPKFIYVTPSHQYPIGGILPIQRRVQLIQYARTTGCYIVEDDYDSEFRYESAPVSSLQGLDPDRVIYIGTFSKILSPALRMGYLILPQSLIDSGRQLKWFTDLHTPSLEQLILARFIEKGYLERHIVKMKKLYRKRRDFMIHCLESSFGDNVVIMGHSTGLHLIAQFTNVHFTPSLLERIEQNGVKVYPVEIHAISKGKQLDPIILGYGNVSEEKIAIGIERLSFVLQSFTQHNHH